MIGSHAKVSVMKASVKTHVVALYKEIQIRKIPFHGKLKKMMWYNKTKLVKKQELGMLSQHPVRGAKNENPMTIDVVKDVVKDVVPQSDELKVLLSKLRALDAEKKEAKQSRG
jgi:hypothetical protein